MRTRWKWRRVRTSLRKINHLGATMILRSVRLSAFLLATSVLASAPPAEAQQADLVARAQVPNVVHYGTWGVDISTRDLSVNPGDDFQRYAAGKWLDANEIPADKSQNGVGSELADRNQEQLRAIIMVAPNYSELGAFYTSYMDEPRLEQLDAAPLKPDLQKVAAIKTKAEFTRYMAHPLSGLGSTVYALGT